MPPPPRTASRQSRAPSQGATGPARQRSLRGRHRRRHSFSLPCGRGCRRHSSCGHSMRTVSSRLMVPPRESPAVKGLRPGAEGLTMLLSFPGEDVLPLTEDSGLATSSNDCRSAGTPKGYLHDASNDHHTSADEIAGKEPEVVVTIPDQHSVEPRSDGPKCLSDGEEDGDRLCSDFHREYLTDGQVGGTGTEGRKEDDNAPTYGLRCRVESSGLKEEGADDQE